MHLLQWKYFAMYLDSLVSLCTMQTDFTHTQPEDPRKGFLAMLLIKLNRVVVLYK